MPVLERMANSVSQGRSARKARTPRLWFMSPTATLWSRFGMSSARAFGISGASSCGEPAMWSLVPTAISVGAGSARPRARDRFWREPRMQAASALRSLLVCSAKARNMRSVGSVSIVERGRLHGIGDAERQARAFDEVDAEPAEQERAHALGMVERQSGRDARAHRVAHHVGPVDAEMVEQAPASSAMTSGV